MFPADKSKKICRRYFMKINDSNQNELLTELTMQDAASINGGVSGTETGNPERKLINTFGGTGVGNPGTTQLLT
jgi:hypothetical protein